LFSNILCIWITTIISIIPPVDCILNDIKSRMSKNKGNLKYYELKGKIKHQENNKERSKQDGSDTEEDEEIKTISNNGGNVL